MNDIEKSGNTGGNNAGSLPPGNEDLTWSEVKNAMKKGAINGLGKGAFKFFIGLFK